MDNKAIFITATGTDVGKTYVTALLVKALREKGKHAGYYKAALSGAEKQEDGSLLPGDAAYVASIAGMKETPSSLVSYLYEAAVSPHLAAKWEGHPVELSQVKEDFQKALSSYDYVTVEGCGGIVCPIRWDQQKLLLEDIITTLGLGVLIVATPALGSINDSVLTASYLKEKHIPIQGFIMNRFHETDPMEVDNCHMIEELTGIPIVGTVTDGADELQLRVDDITSLYSQPKGGPIHD